MAESLVESLPDAVLARFLPGADRGTMLTPLGGNVILQPVDQDLQPEGSKIVLVAQNVPVNRGIVLAIGPEVKVGLMVGDVVQHPVPVKGATTVRENGRVLAVMPAEAFVVKETGAVAAKVRAQALEDPHPVLSRSPTVAAEERAQREYELALGMAGLGGPR